MRSNRFPSRFWYALRTLNETDRLKRERDFYKRLVELNHATAIEPLLQEALQFALELSGAEQAYLRLNDGDLETPHPASLAHECTTDDLTSIEDRISQGIVAEAMAKGQTIQTPSALLDARFKDRKSVRSREIEAVLCAPIGSSPDGVIYLQGRAGGGPFADETVQMVETFAKHLGLLTHQLLQQQDKITAEDPTQEWRAKLAADALVGRSQALADVLKFVASAAQFDGMKVLLTGPSGSGKTAIAEVIASSSKRASTNFQKVNCANLTDTLLEADLFGAKAGAHSTALEDVPGKIDRAAGGTLFLDEVTELTPTAQAKLLHFLQSGEYFKLGDPKPRTADVRIIAATNIDLDAAVKDGKFRQDLLYRLDVLRIPVPSLEQRTEDIPDLVESFLRRAAQAAKTPALRASPGAIRAATAAPWPGNVRQLEHACTRGLTRAVMDGAAMVEARHLFPDASHAEQSPTLQARTQEFQGKLLRDALERNGWNVSKTARELDIARAHAYNLIRQFELVRPE